MDRSKRAIKTPKRFDDEAYGPSPKQILKPVAEIAKVPVLEPATPKNIIKVKLTTKYRPRDSVSSISNSPTKDSSLTKSLQDAVKELVRLPKESSTNQNKPTKLEEQLTKLRDTSRPKDVAKSKEQRDIKLKDSVAKFRETPKPKEIAKPKELTKLKSEVSNRVAIRTPERDIPFVYRPKSKRPRSPPSYADLIPNLTLPFWDVTTAADSHEKDDPKELVHCQCGISEELGLMVQCETCLTWQHGHCLDMEKAEDVPDGYACRACSDPRFARESMKWAYDQEWLTKGRMKQFSCHPAPEQNIKVLHQINSLIGYAVQLQKLIHSLRAKDMLLLQAKDDDPKLKLFRVPWPPISLHTDGTYFIPTINHPSSTPASTISAIADNETADPADITVEAVSDAPLPDIGQMEDVSAILESPSFVQNAPINPNSGNLEATPDECRANLKLHIQQTEEFISVELMYIENQLISLEKECAAESSLDLSIDSLKSDLSTIKKYLSIVK